MILNGIEIHYQGYVRYVKRNRKCIKDYTGTNYNFVVPQIQPSDVEYVDQNSQPVDGYKNG